MAFQVGTASGYLDLLDKVRIFATTDPGLVAAGQNWEEMRWDGAVQNTELYLRGPGMDGTKNIHVQIRAYENEIQDWFNWAFAPAIGYLSSSTWATQPGYLAANEKGCCLWDLDIPYWLVVNGMRIILVYQISTTFHVIHLGWLFHYGTPGQYPYPIIVGGTMPAANTWRWSSTDTNHRNFYTGGTHSPIRYIDGTYLTNLQSYPYQKNFSLRDNFDGSYPLIPIVLSNTTPNTFGEIDGLFWIPGFSNAAGNTFTLDGSDYIVLQNVFRTTNNDYAALRLF